MTHLADQIAECLSHLHPTDREPFIIETEPHDYGDGTTHFTHVCQDILHSAQGEKLRVYVGEYVSTPMAELMCLLYNNVDDILKALHKQKETG